jgi:hypothetical protein
MAAGGDFVGWVVDDSSKPVANAHILISQASSA